MVAERCPKIEGPRGLLTGHSDGSKSRCSTETVCCWWWKPDNVGGNLKRKQKARQLSIWQWCLGPWSETEKLTGRKHQMQKQYRVVKSIDSSDRPGSMLTDDVTRRSQNGEREPINAYSGTQLTRGAPHGAGEQARDTLFLSAACGQQFPI